MIRHRPPCGDPECMPCWWDALDQEMSRALAETREEHHSAADGSAPA